LSNELVHPNLRTVCSALTPGEHQFAAKVRCWEA
jgi:hypothetical protein